jgi:hypothetical protein
LPGKFLWKWHADQRQDVYQADHARAHAGTPAGRAPHLRPSR